jgi:hypothetical protein
MATVFLSFAHVASAQDFRPVVDQFARAWQRGDVATIGSITATRGMALDVEGRRVGPLPGRQAAAALRRVFDDRETLDLQVNMQKEVAGEPRRAFAELNWVTRARGTTIPERTTVVVFLELEGNHWRITDIRTDVRPVR